MMVPYLLKIKSRNMFTYIKKFTGMALVALMLLSQTACNKIEEAEPLEPANPSGQTIREIVDTDAKYSLLKLGLTKAGLMDLLGNKLSKLTLFAPDNEAMARSGVTEAMINGLPVPQLRAIMSYHIIPQALPSAAIPGLPAPNVQMPTLLQPLATQPLFKMSTFPSKRATGAYVNNVPVTAVDRLAANGVIHDVYGVVLPPSTTMKGLIAADPQLSFLRAAIARADEGSEGLSKIDSLLNYPFPNITLFAPTDDAFKALLTFLKLPADPAVFAMLPVQTVRGIVAYHVLAINGVPAQRIFQANMESRAYETLIGPTPMPPVTIDASLPFAKTVKGNVNPTPSNIDFAASDRHAVNGVLHKIDQVLLPQMP